MIEFIGALQNLLQHFTNFDWTLSTFDHIIPPTELSVQVQVQVTLRLTVCQSVSLDVEPHLGLITRDLLLLNIVVLFFVGRPL
jgi:hypothetical protein